MPNPTREMRPLQNSQRPFPALNSESRSLPLLSSLDTKEVPPKISSGSKKSEESNRPPGVSAIEEKRYLRVQGQLEENLVGMAGAMAAIPFLQKDSLTTLEHTPHLSDAWMNVCRRDKRVLEATERFLQNSVWLPLVAVVGAFGVSIAANHGLDIPALIGMKKKDEKEKKEENTSVFSEEERAMHMITTMVARKAERDSQLSVSE